jgi:circadian clock protein KaiC
MIHAASIDIDLENYINQNTVIVVRVAQPMDSTEFKTRDEFLSEYLQEIISVINQYHPAKIIFDELTPYVEFEDPDMLRDSFGSMVETIEDMGITSLLILREPIAQSAKIIFNVLNSFATGVIWLHKSDDEDSKKPGVIEIIPNIGHTEGKFKANYFVEPYKGITTDFNVTKRTTRENLLPEIKEIKPGKNSLSSIPEFMAPNIYNVNDFKLIINNQIALFKTTGQLFTIISLRLNPFIYNSDKVTFEKLSNSVRAAASTKDKVCTIGDKIYVLITKSDNGIVEDFIFKVHESLNITGSSNVSYLVLKVNDLMNNVDDIFNEFELESARMYLNQR